MRPLDVESSPERLSVGQCAAFAGTYLLFGSHLQCRDLAGSALPQSALPACHTWGYLNTRCSCPGHLFPSLTPLNLCTGKRLGHHPESCML